MGFPHTDEYFDALRKENFRRVSIYTEKDWQYEIIPGIKLKPITLRMYAVLDLNNSAFLFNYKSDDERNEILNVTDILFFLWVCSTEYVEDKDKRDKWNMKAILSLKDIDVNEVKKKCYEYYAESVNDWFGISTKSSDNTKALKSSEPYACNVSDMVFVISKTTGWGRDYILDSALIELGQYYRHAMVEVCHDLSFSNYNVGKAARAYMRNRNKKH